MFEKESKEYENNAEYVDIDDYGHKIYDSIDIELAYQKGAECGYDKAIEWYFVENGDLPKCDENTKLWLYFKDYCANDRDCEHPIYRTANGVYRKAFLNEDVKVFVEEGRGYSSEILLKDMIAWQYLPTPPNYMNKLQKSNLKEVDRLLLEYMKKRNLTFEDLQEHIMMREERNFNDIPELKITSYWYKFELILSVIQKFDFKSPFIARSELNIKKGDW